MTGILKFRRFRSNVKGVFWFPKKLRLNIFRSRRKREKEKVDRYVTLNPRDGLRSVTFEVTSNDVPRLSWGWEPKNYDEAVRTDQRMMRMGGVSDFHLTCTFDYRFLAPNDYGERSLQEVQLVRSSSVRDRIALSQYDETQKALKGLFPQTDLCYEQVVGLWFPSYLVWIWDLDNVVIVHDITDFKNTLLDRVRVRRKFMPELEARHRRKDETFARLREQGVLLH